MAADQCYVTKLSNAQRMLKSAVMWTDDTLVNVLGDENLPYSICDFTTSQRQEGPQQILDGFRGDLQASAYARYDAIYVGSTECRNGQVSK